MLTESILEASCASSYALESSCAYKKTTGIAVLKTFRNGNKKTTQPIRISS